MKCEFCSWSQKPDNMPAVKTHVESHHKGMDPLVVWRNGEFVVAKKVTKKETLFDVGVVHYEPAPAPEVFVPSDGLTNPVEVAIVDTASLKD